VFTGLIQSLGTLSLVSDSRLQVNAPQSSILADLAIGDSIAVDGACLTVETILDQGFVVTISPETLRRTTLMRQVQSGASVNLEPALQVGGRLGGHFVTGHVDGVGQLLSLDTAGESWDLRFSAPMDVAPYLVAKGSIAVNGISLTVADCHPQGSWFSVAVIPHSFANTNLQHLQPGAAVNLEADLLGKYAAKLLRVQLPVAETEWMATSSNLPELSEITLEYLAEHGFG
jgi:riboflavin synthase